jgi:hypothetical protein
MDSKNHTVMYLLGMSSIALALAFMISPNNNNNDNNVMAQPSSSYTMGPNRPNPMMSMSSGLQNQNQSWTGSISLFSPIIDAFKSKIHTTLSTAITTAISAVGGGAAAGSNASAGGVAAFIHPENGFLVYSVFVLDPNNNIHKVIIDPGNGKVLSNQQMSMMDAMFMMHPSMGTGAPGMMMGPPPQASPLVMGMMMGPPSMMMDRGMGGMMQHDMMMGGGGPPDMTVGPPHNLMMDRGMMDNGMGMMGWH